MIDFLCVLIFIVIVVCLFSGKRVIRDDTDPPGGYSNMRLFTDHATGVQYLGTITGGITPRLNPDGSLHVVTDHDGRTVP